MVSVFISLFVAVWPNYSRGIYAVAFLAALTLPLRQQQYVMHLLEKTKKRVTFNEISSLVTTLKCKCHKASFADASTECCLE